MSQTIQYYKGTPPVLTTITDATIDESHPVKIVDVGETEEYDIDITDDQQNNEVTTFIGISPKR